MTSLHQDICNNWTDIPLQCEDLFKISIVPARLIHYIHIFITNGLTYLTSFNFYKVEKYFSVKVIPILVVNVGMEQVIHMN